MRTKPTRFYSNKQEQEVSKILDGKRVANSGAATFVGGDVQTDLFLIECKTSTTQRQSMSIKCEWLDKLEEERVGMKKKYKALVFDFGPNTDRHYVIDEKLFRKLNDYMKEEYNGN